MFCPKCGSENADNYKFCRICGNPLAARSEAQKKQSEPGSEAPKAEAPRGQQAGAAREPERAARPQGAPVYTSQPGFAGAAPAVSRVSTMAERAVQAIRSPLTLITIILFTLVLVLEIVGLATGGAGLEQVLDELPTDVSINFTGTAVVSGIAAQIPAILICVGMWLTYVAVIGKKPGEISTTGLTIIKVVIIIIFVLACIGAVLAVLFALFGFESIGVFDELSGLSDVDLAGAAGAAGVILIIFVAAFLVLGILFFVKLLGTISWTKAQLRNESSSKGPSLYAAVIIFISAFLSLISLITAGGVVSSIGYMVPSEYRDALDGVTQMISGGIIVSLISVACLVLCGVLILKLREIRNSISA